nr:TetR family transcriptional regulator C-terminal domain-containing protein [Streptomyces sp. SID3343]
MPLSSILVSRFADVEAPTTAILDLVDELAAPARDPSASGLLVELLRQADRDPELVDVVARTARIVRDGLADLIERGITDGTVDVALVPAEAAAWIQTVVDAVFLNADPARDPTSALRRTVARYLAPPSPNDTRGNNGEHHG